MKKLLSVFLSTVFIFNTALGQPLAYPETNTEEESAMIWVPAPVDLQVGDLELTVFFLQPQVPAPHAGYLVLSDDWIDIRRKLDFWDEEVKRIRESETESCKIQLDEKTTECQELNAGLRTMIDNQAKDIKKLEVENEDLKSELWWWKGGAIVLGVTTTSLAIYSSLK